MDVPREFFLQRLPSAIRAALPEAEDISVTDLVVRADKLIVAARASDVRCHTTFGGPRTEDNVNIASFSRRSSKQPARQGSSQSQPIHDVTKVNETLSAIQPSGLCGYHNKFGPKARRCSPGCVWHQLQSLLSKNAAADRA